MATAQSPIFCLLLIYHFATAHFQIIYLLQIEQLLQNCKSSRYLITVQRKIIWQLQFAYLEIFRRFMWLLRTAQFFVYCASFNYFLTAHLTINSLLQIDQLFHHWKSSNYLLTLRRNIVWHFQIAYLKHFDDLYDYCAKPNFLATAHHTIIFLICISKLFVYCKSTN